ncbi:MAG: electron transport complex subunit E [Psychromonas sp.]|nr:electron transport complex subunit E [Psychromonas sp.]
MAHSNEKTTSDKQPDVQNKLNNDPKQSIYKELMWQGLWKNNPGVVQLLGLCPLLAVTNTATNALGLGIATTAVLVTSNTVISLLRHHIPATLRIPIFVMIIASLVTCVQLLMNAYTYEVYLSLGIFIPLIVTNCNIIGRAEAFASKNKITHSAFDGLMMGLGFSCVLMILGATREVLAQGTVFDGIQTLLGGWAAFLTVHIYHSETRFLLAALPPGAFIIMGIIIAIKNTIDEKIDTKR